MAAPRKRRKAPAKRKPRRWILSKLLLLLGLGGLVAFIVALFVMEQELSRIGFFTNLKRPSLRLPAPLQNDSPAAPTVVPFSPPPQAMSQPPAQGAGQSARESVAPRTAEDRVREERQHLEELSHDDRKQLDDLLRSR